MDLRELRDKIDVIDKQLVELYEERMKVSDEIADYKMYEMRLKRDKYRRE